jgi:hypothetical protein
MYKPQLGIGNHVMPLIKTKTPDQVIKLTQKLHELTFRERERDDSHLIKDSVKMIMKSEIVVRKVHLSNIGEIYEGCPFFYSC